MAYERTLKDAFRYMLNRELMDLTYNIGYHCLRHRRMPMWWYGFRHRKGGQNMITYNGWDGVDFGGYFEYSTGTYEGKTSYTYRPKKMLPGWKGKKTDPYGNVVDPYIMYHDFSLTDIESEEVLPLQAIPQGAPSTHTYHLKNNRPKPYADEFEVEDTKEKQQEKTFGWLAAQEYEETIKGQAGVSVQVEATARFQQRVEKHGDQRWLETSNHRQLLRGKHPVGPYAILNATITDQQTKMKQPIRIQGKLESKILVVVDPMYAAQYFDTIEEMLDTFRGFGGGGTLDQVFGQSGHAVTENILQDKIIKYLPKAYLELVPQDIKVVNESKDLTEVPYPGHEEPPDGDGLYEKYKPKPGGGDDMFGGGGFGDDTDVDDGSSDFDTDDTDVDDGSSDLDMDDTDVDDGSTDLDADPTDPS